MEKLVGNPAVNRLITGERVIPQALLLAGRAAAAAIMPRGSSPPATSAPIPNGS